MCLTSVSQECVPPVQQNRMCEWWRTLSSVSSRTHSYSCHPVSTYSTYRCQYDHRTSVYMTTRHSPHSSEVTVVTMQGLDAFRKEFITNLLEWNIRLGFRNFQLGKCHGVSLDLCTVSDSWVCSWVRAKCWFMKDGRASFFFALKVVFRFQSRGNNSMTAVQCWKRSAFFARNN